MIGVAKETLAQAIRWSGAALLARRLLARRRASILFYHDPSPEVFERHLAYMAPRYNFATLAQVVDALHRRDWSSVPPRSVVITFDDGHRGTFELLELFRRYAVRPTIYLCTQIVGTGRHYWFKELGPGAATAKQSLKRLPEADRQSALERTIGFRREREYPPQERQALDAGEIVVMREFVDFESHGRFHPILTTCREEECREEIVGSRREVEALTAAPCQSFSYPNGDWGERERRLVMEAGYRSARTIDIGWTDLRSDPYALRILGTPDTASVARLAADLSGFGYLLRTRGGSLRGRHRPIEAAG